MRERGSSGAWATLRALEEEEENIADNNAENNTANSAKNNNAEKTTHSEQLHRAHVIVITLLPVFPALYGILTLYRYVPDEKSYRCSAGFPQINRKVAPVSAQQERPSLQLM